MVYHVLHFMLVLMVVNLIRKVLKTSNNEVLLFNFIVNNNLLIQLDLESSFIL